ncbi:hypothetical protein K440DRAFT_641684 [Wilcoxina mikolae CBS 423.85]|nr:hypothetical protein K440DRAFT_641684 [Wilcoxina mikolae CBS 423.85]
MSNPQPQDPASPGNQIAKLFGRTRTHHGTQAFNLSQFLAKYLTFPLRLGNQRYRHNNPRSYILPTHSYGNQAMHHQYDAMGRPHTGYQNDGYLSPNTGCMKRLVVQATDAVCKHNHAHTWGRVKMEGIGPWIVTIANWPWEYKKKFPLENTLHWPGFIGVWLLTCTVVSFLRLLFGSYNKRLTWSAAGSTLSHHRLGDNNRREGCDPRVKPSFAQHIRDGRAASNTAERVFTLVDTGTMTVLSFLAVKPPTAAIICGQEGEMLRVALCGYDWTSNTFYRETVIRMETTVQDKMKRVVRLKFAFQRSGTLTYQLVQELLWMKFILES